MARMNTPSSRWSNGRKNDDKKATSEQICGSCHGPKRIFAESPGSWFLWSASFWTLLYAAAAMRAEAKVKL